MQNNTSNQDLFFMQKAINLANEAENDGNLPIGALVVLDGKIIAEAKNSVFSPFFNLGGHAEMLAIQQINSTLLARRGKDMIIYTNTEPCLMCLGTIVLHKIGKIVFGGCDKNKGASYLINELDRIYTKEQRPIIVGPITQEECGKMWERANVIYRSKLAHIKTQIQIAGITNVKDAIMCAQKGMDIIGLLVGQKHNSTEFISKELAKEIKQALPPNVKTTLITHLETAEPIIENAEYIDVDYIQLHSNIEENEVEKIKKALPNKKLIRVIHILQNGEILTNLSKIKYADFYITDSINIKTNQVGGTGLPHNYNIDKQLVATLNKPVFVAGGLTPKNVKEVIKLCTPYGVDVNSGCRGKNGLRDPEKVTKFVENVRNSYK